MRRILAGVLAAVTVLALSVGCTVQQVGPKLEIVRAAQAFAAASRVSLTFRAAGNVEDLIAMVRKGGATDEDARSLREIYNSSLTVAWDKAGNGAADDRSLVKAVLDGVTGVEIRTVGQTMYVRVPFRELAAKVGASKADVESLRQQLGPRNAGVNTLIGGGWVWVSVADLQKLSQQATGVAPLPVQQQQKQEKKFAKQLMISAANLLDSADVTYDRRDRTHLIVTTSTVKAYQEGKRLFRVLKKISDKPTAEMLDETLGAAFEKAPADHPIVLDLWIDHGRFKAIEFNLLQFVKGSTGRAGLRIEFSRGKAINAPRHADRFDLNSIFKAKPAARKWAELVGV